MKAKVVLIARVNDGTGTFPSIPVNLTAKRIVTPVKREKDGKLFNGETILGFYARYPQNGKRRVEPLGKDPVSAYTRYLQIESDFTRMQQGRLPVYDVSVSRVIQMNSDRKLSTLAKRFITNKTTLGSKKRTIAHYKRTLDAFTGQFPDKTIDQITKEDVIAHLEMLKKTTTRKKVGDRQYLLRGRLQQLTVFFNSLKTPMPLAMKEVKKPSRTTPTRYSVELVNAFLAVANENEKDMIHFLLNTGFREEEMMYTYWRDITFKEGSINVSAKPEYDWTPKDNEPREQDIVLQEKFIERMKARKKRSGNSLLIFPTEVGKPDGNFLRIVKRIAKKAGIMDKRITLHGFRRTFGSMVAKTYGLEQARIWLGHGKLETTQKYIAADEMTTTESRAKAAEMFSGVGD